MELGDFVKKILSPFVKGTKLESCKSCEIRRVKLNMFSTWFSDWYRCPCHWWNRFKK